MIITNKVDLIQFYSHYFPTMKKQGNIEKIIALAKAILLFPVKKIISLFTTKSIEERNIQSLVLAREQIRDIGFTSDLPYEPADRAFTTSQDKLKKIKSYLTIIDFTVENIKSTEDLDTTMKMLAKKVHCSAVEKKNIVIDLVPKAIKNLITSYANNLVHDIKTAHFSTVTDMDLSDAYRIRELNKNTMQEPAIKHIAKKIAKVLKQENNQGFITEIASEITQIRNDGFTLEQKEFLQDTVYCARDILIKEEEERLPQEEIKAAKRMTTEEIAQEFTFTLSETKKSPEKPRFYFLGSNNQLRFLNYKAILLQVSFIELLEATKKSNLDQVIERAEKVKEKCDFIFEKLDMLYHNEHGKIYTKNEFHSISRTMTPEALKIIKSVVRSGYKAIYSTLEKELPLIEVIIPITKDYSVLARSYDTSLEIIGLFGKLLGKGGYGVAVQRLNLLEGKWEEGEKAVCKIPLCNDINSARIIKETMLLSKICEEKNIVGIQKPLQIIENAFPVPAALQAELKIDNLPKHTHLGALYEGDLHDITLSDKRSLSIHDKISIAYQLVYGVSYIHQKNITHGDIKPENVFYNSYSEEKEKRESQYTIYLGDFGESIDHTESIPLCQKCYTLLYRTYGDTRLSKKVYREEDFQTYLAIEKKADVFATCSSICSTFLGMIPYKGIPGSDLEKYTLLDELAEQLEKVGLSTVAADLLVQGLHIDYEKRPMMKNILQVIQNELYKINPGLYGQLTASIDFEINI